MKPQYNWRFDALVYLAALVIGAVLLNVPGICVMGAVAGVAILVSKVWRR